MEQQEELGKEPKVLFVGDRPSKANTDGWYAFKGTKSGTTLGKWLSALSLTQDDCIMINQVDEYFADCARSFHRRGYPVIALGRNAELALIKSNIPHFTMPHPSGRNRLLNNKQVVALSLARCRQYI